MISLLPLWLLLIWLPIAFFIARYFYQPKEWVADLNKKIRYSFIAIRFVSLALIGFLLLGILFESISYRKEKPMLITVVDNSQSMLNYKDKNQVPKDVTDLMSTIDKKFKNRFNIVNYKIDAEIATFDNKKLFSGSKTDLSAAFQHIRNLYSGKNIGGIVLVSDGNFNTGSSPIYAAEKLKFTPVFNLGVGDTVAPKDQLIRAVMSNEIAFLKNKFPIEVDLEAYKIQGASARVSVSLNGRELASQNVSWSNESYQYKRLSFLVESGTIGVNSIKVNVAAINGEYSTQNNSYTSYIEILDARSKVLMLAGAPHPDVSAIKSALEIDQNIQVVSKLTKDWDKSLIGIDFVIWHEPGVNFDASVANLLNTSKKSILYVIGTGTTPQSIQSLNLGIRIPINNRTDEVLPIVNRDFQNFVIDPKLVEMMQYYPPLKVRFGEIQPPKSAEVVLYQGVGNIQKSSPILYFAKNETGKYGVLIGEGLWKWKLNEKIKTGKQDQFNSLISSTRQYLTVRDNSSALRVTPPKRLIIGEDCIFKAEFYNDALELITTPKINLVIKDKLGKVSKYDFANMQNFYNLRFSGLAAGTYSWEASTNYKGKSYRKNGIFVIEDLKLEAMDSYANHTALKQLATQSNGHYDQLSNFNKVLTMIENRKDITNVEFKESILNNLINYKFIFFLLFVLLGLEWFGRRWFGGY
jgi:hypothetical protein